MTPLRMLLAVVGLLGLLFLGPIAYYTGKHIGLYFVCPFNPDPSPTAERCWEETGRIILQGGVACMIAAVYARKSTGTL